ncbi:MAG: alpha-E domain-containing protein, partial [Nitrospirales bacterium]|nr:alpha-E domain-containing protein [Nitrospirales bacterium]
MLSRTAESFFWIGRYVERAEYTARFTDVHYHLLTEIASQDDQADTWIEYLDGTGEYRIQIAIELRFRIGEVIELCRRHLQRKRVVRVLKDRG